MLASKAFRPGLFGSALVLALAVAGVLRSDDKKEGPAPKPPPEGAKVIFGAKTKDLADWTTRQGEPAEWKVENGYLEVAPGKKDVMTKEKFGPDFQLHAEFWIPLMPDATGQGRGNSGVYLQGRYEIQVLDSYMNETYANGVCGALYGI